MTATNTEIELIDLTEFEFPRVCRPWGQLIECDREATWLVTKKCCRIEIPMCDGHYATGLKEIEELKSPTYCFDCKTTWNDSPRDAFWIERI